MRKERGSDYTLGLTLAAKLARLTRLETHSFHDTSFLLVFMHDFVQPEEWFFDE